MGWRPECTRLTLIDGYVEAMAAAIVRPTHARIISNNSKLKMAIINEVREGGEENVHSLLESTVSDLVSLKAERRDGIPCSTPEQMINAEKGISDVSVITRLSHTRCTHSCKCSLRR